MLEMPLIMRPKLEKMIHFRGNDTVVVTVKVRLVLLLIDPQKL